MIYYLASKNRVCFSFDLFSFDSATKVIQNQRKNASSSALSSRQHAIDSIQVYVITGAAITVTEQQVSLGLLAEEEKSTLVKRLLLLGRNDHHPVLYPPRQYLLHIVELAWLPQSPLDGQRGVGRKEGGPDRVLKRQNIVELRLRISIHKAWVYIERLDHLLRRLSGPYGHRNQAGVFEGRVLLPLFPPRFQVQEHLLAEGSSKGPQQTDCDVSPLVAAVLDYIAERKSNRVDIDVIQ